MDTLTPCQLRRDAGSLDGGGRVGADLLACVAAMLNRCLILRVSHGWRGDSVDAHASPGHPHSSLTAANFGRPAGLRARHGARRRTLDLSLPLAGLRARHWSRLSQKSPNPGANIHGSGVGSLGLSEAQRSEGKKGRHTTQARGVLRGARHPRNFRLRKFFRNETRREIYALKRKRRNDLVPMAPITETLS